LCEEIRLTFTHTESKMFIMLNKKHSSLGALTWGWGIASALLMTAGYAIYIYFFLHGDTLPNATSWGLWALGGAIEAWSFFKVVQAGTERHRQLPFLFSPLICAIFAIVVASIGIGLGRWSLPTMWEIMVAVLDVTVVLTYFVIKWMTGEQSRAARFANALMLLDILLTFIPIYGTTLLSPENERAFPWLIWTLAYSIMALMGWSQIQHHWKERRWLVFYPAASAVFHGGIALIVLTLSGI
jgi:hypothetical protein